MRKNTRKFNCNFFDLVSAAILFASFLFMISLWDFLPVFFDWAYHAAIGVEILHRGFITDNLYQFAPAGRPLIYPPLMGYVFAAIMYLGADALTAARALSLFFLPSFLFSYWFFARKKCGPLCALFFLVALASNYSLFFWMAQPTPISLVITAAPLAFLMAERLMEKKASWKGKAALAALLSVLLYMHFAALYFVALPMAVVALWKKSKELLRAIAASLLVFLPWAVHIILNLQHIKFVHFQDSFYLSPVLLLFAAAFVVSKGAAKFLKDSSVAMFSAMAFVIFLVVLFHPTRVFAYVTIPLAFFAAVFLSSASKKKNYIVVVLVLAFLLSAVTEFSLVYDAGKAVLETRRNPMIMGVIAPRQLGLEGRDHYVALAEWIKNNTKEDDIIVTYDLNDLSTIVTSLTGRRTTWGMFSEVRPVYSLVAARNFAKANGTIEVERYIPNIDYERKEIARFGSIIVFNISGTANISG